MQNSFPNPRVVLSKCLEFDACRYNGQRIPDSFVAKLNNFVEFIPTCPEVEIGLGVPRDPIRIVKIDGTVRLYQESTGKDVSDDMEKYSARFLNGLEPVDGFILKSRSPSCGIKDVKIYSGVGSKTGVSKRPGFFGSAVLDKFEGLAIEDEGRLRHFTLRENFLTRLFAFADLRLTKSTGKMKNLVAFHSNYKLLLMAYNQSELRKLGRIVANPDKLPFGELIIDYERHFQKALSKTIKFTNNINVLMHVLGYFSKHLAAAEKAVFLDSLERYREEKIPLSAVLSIIRIWLAKYEQPYLETQRYFMPYPEELVEITDSGKGRVSK